MYNLRDPEAGSTIQKIVPFLMVFMALVTDFSVQQCFWNASAMFNINLIFTMKATMISFIYCPEMKIIIGGGKFKRS